MAISVYDHMSWQASIATDCRQPPPHVSFSSLQNFIQVEAKCQSIDRDTSRYSHLQAQRMTVNSYVIYVNEMHSYR